LTSAQIIKSCIPADTEEQQGPTPHQQTEHWWTRWMRNSPTHPPAHLLTLPLSHSVSLLPRSLSRSLVRLLLCSHVPPAVGRLMGCTCMTPQVFTHGNAHWRQDGRHTRVSSPSCNVIPSHHITSHAMPCFDISSHHTTPHAKPNLILIPSHTPCSHDMPSHARPVPGHHSSFHFILPLASHSTQQRWPRLARPCSISAGWPLLLTGGHSSLCVDWYTC
jgi:hypothetical protein